MSYNRRDDQSDVDQLARTTGGGGGKPARDVLDFQWDLAMTRGLWVLEVHSNDSEGRTIVVCDDTPRTLSAAVSTRAVSDVVGTQV